MFETKITAETAPPLSTGGVTARRGRWAWVAGALLLAAVAGLVAMRGGTVAPAASAPEAPAPLPVLTVSLGSATTRPLTARVVGDGSVVAWQELVVGAEIGGLRLVEVPVEEGQAVRAGQLLARLDDSVLAAQAAQAEAAMVEATASRDLARAELARSESLVRSQSASIQLAEQRRSAALQAEARLAAARARRDEVVARLAQTRILAPSDGIVLRVAARIGGVSAAGQEMVRILRDGRLELDARVPELDLADVRPGQPVTVRHGDRRLAGEVRAIAPLVAADTRLGIVHVALPPGAGLRPGMFARAEITGPTRQVVVVPAAAIVFRDGAARAFVLPEGRDRVELRRLATGAREEGVVEVLDGILPGEWVVVAGAGFLADGDLVRVAPAAGLPAAGAAGSRTAP